MKNDLKKEPYLITTGKSMTISCAEEGRLLVNSSVSCPSSTNTSAILTRTSIGSWKALHFCRQNYRERLMKIKNNIKSNSKWKQSISKIPEKEQKQIFHEKREAILPVKFSTEKIADSLKWYENNTKTYHTR